LPTLYHHPLCPFSRKARVLLHEKRVTFDEVVQETWTHDAGFLSINPAGEVPTFLEDDGTLVADAANLAEYLDEVFPEPKVVGRSLKERTEARRLAAWFDRKFFEEVTINLAGEKLNRRILNNEPPDSRALKAGRDNLTTHLQYIAWLTDRRSWLAGDHLTVADISAAAHLSLIDYTGDVPWEDHPLAKEWYVRIKSRPSFRGLLRDVLGGIAPAPAYTDLDF
jgi:glutathione S-transferase